MILISFLIAFVLTLLLWPFFSGALANSRRRQEERLNQADPETRAALEFNLPPKAIRTGRRAALIQFGLILLLLTVVTHLLIGNI